MNLAELKQMPWADAIQYLSNEYVICGKWTNLLNSFTSLEDFLERATAEEKSEAACWWTVHSLEDRDLMRPLVFNSWDAYWWATRFPEDRASVRSLITRSEAAYRWAAKFPEDRELMRPLITGSLEAYYWAKEFPEDTEYFAQKGLL